MGKISLLIVATLALAVSCISSRRSVGFIHVCQPGEQVQQEPTVQDPVGDSPRKEPKSYLIRVNFVLFKDEVQQSPQVVEEFMGALKVWADNLPIECMIYTEDATDASPWSTIPGMIKVHIVDVQKAYMMEDGVLGFYEARTDTLALDVDSLITEKAMAHNVIVHELGHLFGLQHMMNQGEYYALTGYTMIPDSFDASTLVMFPYLSKSNESVELTNFEIGLALKTLSNLQRLDRHDCLQLTKL
jgi:hypothetical protein